MVKRLSVELGERSYEIIIGEQLLANAGDYIAPLLKRSNIIIVSDETVAGLYLDQLGSALERVGIGHQPVIIGAGESSKSWEPFGRLLESILALKPDRNTMLVALGGGVVGDMTGFAASIILRGVDFIQIPTTLLAQVDSSVGGKTGINASVGKNLIGSFYQPKLVLIDTQTLASLPKRQLLAGYAEIVKYGLINNPGFFEWLEMHAAALLAGDAVIQRQAVQHSCHAKATIVSADETEQGSRALLNLGHTFGHALEAETGYGEALLHGEAVAIGINMAYHFSHFLGLCSAQDAERVTTHLQTHDLPAWPNDIRAEWDITALMEHFTRDKKATKQGFTFILTHGIGQSFVASGVDARRLAEFLGRL